VEPAGEYQRIQDYGIIGDLHTTALVGRTGSIDFMCFPNFDSPSIFAALLDRKKGGYFLLAPYQETNTSKQIYLTDSNILLSRTISGSTRKNWGPERNTWGISRKRSHTSASSVLRSTWTGGCRKPASAGKGSSRRHALRSG